MDEVGVDEVGVDEVGVDAVGVDAVTTFVMDKWELEAVEELGTVVVVVVGSEVEDKKVELGCFWMRI